MFRANTTNTEQEYDNICRKEEELKAELEKLENKKEKKSTILKEEEHELINNINTTIEKMKLIQIKDPMIELYRLIQIYETTSDFHDYTSMCINFHNLIEKYGISRVKNSFFKLCNKMNVSEQMSTPKTTTTISHPPPNTQPLAIVPYMNKKRKVSTFLDQYGNQRYTKPRGRAPKDKVWDDIKGEWIPDMQAEHCQFYHSQKHLFNKNNNDSDETLCL